MDEKFKSHLKSGEKVQLPASTMVNSILQMLRFDPSLYAVFEIWDKETQSVVRGCEAIAISGSRLVVSVPSAAHRQELLYAKDRILSRVNQAMGRRVITDIQFEFKKGGKLGDEGKTRVGFDRN